MRVERESERLTVEVAVRDELAALGEDERIVGGGVQLDRDGLLGVRQQIPARAVNLRRAAQRVRVLHLVAPAVRLDDRRALDQPNDVRGRLRLSRKRSERLDLRPEADARALERLDREGAGDVRNLREPAGPHERERADRAHELRAVDEREPFLGLQADGLEARVSERLRARDRSPSTAAHPSPTRGSAR